MERLPWTQLDEMVKKSMDAHVFVIACAVTESESTTANPYLPEAVSAVSNIYSHIACMILNKLLACPMCASGKLCNTTRIVAA